MSHLSKMSRTLFILSTLFILISCQPGKNKNVGPERPFNPWVFRSVLDQQPRIITLALHDDLWAAYHTDSCSLYKVWKGHVQLQGAVYDNAHGPQPISIGDAWIVNPYLHPWSVQHQGKEVLKEVKYAGHAIHEGRATLRYQLICEDGKTIYVDEQPEVSEKDGQIGFERTYTLHDLPEDYVVSINQHVTSIALDQNLSTNGKWTATLQDKKEEGGKQLLTVDGRLELLPDAPTYFKTYFVSEPTIPNPNKAAGQEEATLPLGQRLIAKNDCKTCHNEKVQTIGPAYRMIAERYPWNEESVATLSNKVISGGSGIWGTQAMSAHPELPKADAMEMVRYILRLDTTDIGQKEGAEVVSVPLVTKTTELKNALPGLMAEVWTGLKSVTKMPSFPPSRPGDQAGIVQDFEGLEAQDFGQLDEDFALVAKGYLYVNQDTLAGIRVLSDDGSKVSIDGQLILDNDGLHGTESIDAMVKLNKGYHPITIEFFQGKGGRYLSFEWKPKGTEGWTGLPSGMLLHSADDHASLKGRTLAMTMGRIIPGDKFPLTSVHPSYGLSQARPNDFLPKVGGMDFMSDGTLAVSVWDPSGAVYLVSNVSSGDPSKIKVKQIASGLAEPLGLKVIHDTIYVMQKQELTRLIDTDHDGIIDEYQCVSNAWPTSANFHEFGFGLAEKDGDLYATLAIAIQPGGASGLAQMPSRGRAVRFDLPSGDLHYVCSGFRTPNGIGIGVDGEIFVADNQGDWLPSSKILHITQDAFFGCRSVDSIGNVNIKDKPPVVWLPQDEIGNSPSTPLAINDGPYKGQMIHGDVTHGGIKRVFVEKVNGEYQGVVFRFIQGLEAGVNRMTWGPDGALYVGGIGNPGNWQQAGKLWYGLQRLKYNGKPTFEMLAVRAKSDGVEIEFTEPLREGDGWDPADWEVRQWRYVPTKDYGGPKVDNVALHLAAVSVSEDRKKVSLKLDGMKEGHVVYVHMNKAYVSESGLPLWSTEAWYTMNQIPSGQPVTVVIPPVFKLNTLTNAEVKEGWKLLFDGTTTAGWHTFKKTTIGKSWIVQDDALMLDARKNPDGSWQAPDGGDIVTADEYENFELNLEWKISPCGNSGIIFNVVESPEYDYVWKTGPEMQVLDNSCHPDTRFVSHRAGDLYDMIPCQYVTVRPAGEWNQVRLIKNKGKVEHWLNGIKVVEYEMYTDQWKQMIAGSKFKDMPGFGLAPKGKIALQDHGDKVWYRNIKIKEIKP